MSNNKSGIITKSRTSPKAWLNRALATKPEYIFLILATTFGLYFVFRVTPLFGNDEIVHFPRAYQVSEGHLKAQALGSRDYGGQLPTQIKQFNDAYREQVQADGFDTGKLNAIKHRYNQETLSDHARQPLVFTSASLSAGWDYLPASLGIGVARLLRLPLNWYVYLSRLGTLITYMVLTYFAIKYLPIGKRFLLFVALLPPALTQATTVGMDSLVNGLSWLIIGLTFAVLVGKLKITPRLLALFVLLNAYLATTKQGYVSIAALPLLIPARFYPFNLRKVWLWRVALGAGLLLISLWYLGSTSHVASIIHYAQRPGLNVDDAAQLHYIYQNPLTFLVIVFIQPITIWSASIYAGMIGIVTNKMLWLPIPIMIMLYIGLGLNLLHKERAHVSGRDRSAVLFSSILAFLTTFVMINFALYLSFTRVGFDHVEGLQGRYFLPLLPLVGIILHTAMPKLFLKLSDRTLSLVSYPITLIALLSTVFVIH